MIFHQTHNSLTNYNSNAFFYTDKIWDYHFHRNLELIYVIKGAVCSVINNREYLLEAGDFGLCLPCDIHRHEPLKDTLYWVLVFSEDFVGTFAKQIYGKKSSGFKFRLNKTVNEYVYSRLITNESPSVFTTKSCLYAVCEEFLNAVSLNNKDSNQAEAAIFIADYVQDNHTKKISLADIARELGYDYNYMSRYFHNTFNMTFTEFVNIYRLESAIKLLEETNKSIIDIALESGFQSVRNFNSFFKAHTGKSPSEYRKMGY